MRKTGADLAAKSAARSASWMTRKPSGSTMHAVVVRNQMSLDVFVFARRPSGSSCTSAWTERVWPLLLMARKRGTWTLWLSDSQFPESSWSLRVMRPKPSALTRSVVARLLLSLLFLMQSSCGACGARRDRNLSVATQTLARQVSYGGGCGGHDWNVLGFADAVKGRDCSSAPKRLRDFVARPEIRAAVLAPSGEVGVVGSDDRCGAAANLDAGIDWIWRMVDCPHDHSLKCFERL